ncbi:hypothetical protein LTR49_026991 [Elasticomyces elasticus]|nr:hypothetical protein LTR49_026991 [Elasticomyces elasticus]
MCFIDLEAQASVDHQANGVNVTQTKTIPAKTKLDPKSLPPEPMAKRKAPSTLEPEHTKKPRASSEITEELAESFSSKTGSSEVMEQQVVQARTDLDTKPVEAEASRYKQLQQEMRHLAKSSEKWHNKYCKVAGELDELQAQQSSRNSGTGVIYQNDHKERMETQKKQMVERFKKQHLAYQKKIDELRLKQASVLKDKDANTEKKIKDIRERYDKRILAAQDKTKEAKDELAENRKKMAELKKELKTEQEEEINKFKPSHSITVKEKDQAIKALTADKTALVDTVERHKKNVDLCEQAINGLTSDKEALEIIIEQYASEKITLSDEIRLQTKDIATILAQKEEGEKRAEPSFGAEVVAWEDRLKHEGKRSVLQCKDAKGLADRVVEQQRANHSVITACRDNNIRTPNSKVRELEAAVVELKAVIAGHTIRIATLKTGDGKTKSMTTVDEDGIPSAETTDIKMKQELESANAVSFKDSGAAATSHSTTKSMSGRRSEGLAVNGADEVLADNCHVHEFGRS